GAGTGGAADGAAAAPAEGCVGALPAGAGGDATKPGEGGGAGLEGAGAASWPDGGVASEAAGGRFHTGGDSAGAGAVGAGAVGADASGSAGPALVPPNCARAEPAPASTTAPAKRSDRKPVGVIGWVPRSASCDFSARAAEGRPSRRRPTSCRKWTARTPLAAAPAVVSVGGGGVAQPGPAVAGAAWAGRRRTVVCGVDSANSRCEAWMSTGSVPARSTPWQAAETASQRSTGSVPFARSSACW